jgi:hypothetical protein
MAFPADSAPGIKVTGPVHHFVQIVTPFIGASTTAAGAGSIFYLGTAEVQPQIKVKKVAIPVKNDIGGRLLPSQNVYQGQMGQIGVALNRFSLRALNEIKVVGGTGGIYKGRDYYNAVGALEFDKYTFRLWQVNGFYNWVTPVVSGATEIPPGRYWPNVRLDDEDDQKIGTIDWTKLLVMTAYKLPTCSSGLWDGVLYSEEAADFPAGVQTPIC